MTRVVQVSIIIVNYKTPELTANAIRSALKQQGINTEIIVIDNASQDHSVEYLHKQFPHQIKLIANSENIGFGRANNLAFKECHGRYIYLLNPDAEIESDYGLANLMQFADQNSQFGIIGTAIYEPRKKRWVKPQSQYPKEKELRTTTLGKLPGHWAWILGASMFIRREVYEKIGGFDADFFLYGEETDLCLRTRKAGYAIGFCDSVKIKHISGATETKSTPYETWLRKQRGFYLFCKKHYDPKDITRIAKKQYRRATIKTLMLKLKNLFNKKVPAKLNRLRATAEVAKENF